MRQTFFFLVISVLSINSSHAQFKEVYATIPRDNPDSYYIHNSSGDSTLVTRKMADEDMFKGDYKYHIAQGKGRVKDETGTKEKRKRYLLTKSRDTLITTRRKSNQIEFADGTFVTKQETENGWNFLNANDEVVYEVELLWNDAKFKYDIKIYEDSDNIFALNKFVTMSLYEMAKYKSMPESQGDDTFWFIMYLAAL